MSKKIPGSAENWENGVLGNVAKHAHQVSREDALAIAQAAGVNMQPISIRLPQHLLGVLKEIAKYHGVGYQPMIRDLLERWATGEIKTILADRLEYAEQREKEFSETPSLAGDLRRQA
ncbi:hypothetical protein [Luteibacter sahnii]|uniref:hypothetical protein n=1 Tax=Luteibacter sahnii TaxID=3021977 RepID=UPI002A6A0FA9|nr:hypothetical protein [Luteibacter sp. PPL193]MDY1548362.1 hypothetical protein [Luteibacter sp. PPL193]